MVQSEAEACSQALSAAASWGVSVLESDCQILLRALQGRDYDRSLEGVIFRDIRQFIRLNFSSIVFAFVSRES